jgi:plastocyanin
MIRIRNIAVALLLVGTVAACGSSSSGGTPPPGPGSSGGGHTITIKNFKFSPASLTVKVGTKVTFVNDDSTVHAPLSSPGSTIDGGNLSKGQTYTVTMTKPGTYNYVCNIHNYMKGTIIVQ